MLLLDIILYSVLYRTDQKSVLTDPSKVRNATLPYSWSKDIQFQLPAMEGLVARTSQPPSDPDPRLLTLLWVTYFILRCRIHVDTLVKVLIFLFTQPFDLKYLLYLQRNRAASAVSRERGEWKNHLAWNNREHNYYCLICWTWPVHILSDLPRSW